MFSCMGSYAVLDTQPLTESARKSQYESSRKDLLAYREAFETCLNFARNRTSYGLKHEA